MFRRRRRVEEPLFPATEPSVPGWVQMRNPLFFVDMFLWPPLATAVAAYSLVGFAEFSRSAPLAREFSIPHAALLWGAYLLGALAGVVIAILWNAALRANAEAIVQEDLKPLSEQSYFSEVTRRSEWPCLSFAILLVVLIVVGLVGSRWTEPLAIFIGASMIAFPLTYPGRRVVYEVAKQRWLSEGTSEEMTPLLRDAERGFRRSTRNSVLIHVTLAVVLFTASFIAQRTGERVGTEKTGEEQGTASQRLEP